MRIAVCGPNRANAVVKAERTLHTNVVKPWNSTIVDYAAETYKHFDESNVVFDGSAFDFLNTNDGEGYEEVYEQIAINTLANLDYIAVLSMDMDKKLLKTYEEYAALFPGKFIIYPAGEEFEVVVR